MKQTVTKSGKFADVLVALERQYPLSDTDLCIQTEIQNLAMLPHNPKAARISELLPNFDHCVGRLTPGSYGSDELLSWLVAKIPRDCAINVRLRRSGRQEPSPMKTCVYFYWSGAGEGQ